MNNDETTTREQLAPPQSWGEAYARQQEEIEDLKARIAELEGARARTRPSPDGTEKPPGEKRKSRKA